MDSLGSCGIIISSIRPVTFGTPPQWPQKVSDQGVEGAQTQQVMRYNDLGGGGGGEGDIQVSLF